QKNKIKELRTICDDLLPQIKDAAEKHKSSRLFGLAGYVTNYPAFAKTLSGIRSYLLDELYDLEVDIPAPLISIKSQIREAKTKERKSLLITEYNKIKSQEILNKIDQLRQKTDPTSIANRNELIEIGFYTLKTGSQDKNNS